MANIKRLEALIDKFIADYTKALDKATNLYIATLPKDITKEALTDIISKQQDVIKKLIGQVDSSLNRTYAEIISLVKSDMKGIAEFTGADIDTILTLKNVDLSSMASVTNSMNAELNKQITMASVTNVPFENIVGVIRDKFDIAKGEAEQIARTSLHSSMQAIRTGKAEESGITYYRYDGPLQENSRDFCREMEGKVLTREEIDAIEAGSYPDGSPHLDDVMIHRGGYNCNHQWIPITDEEAKGEV